MKWFGGKFATSANRFANHVNLRLANLCEPCANRMRTMRTVRAVRAANRVRTVPIRDGRRFARVERWSGGR
jgi:hypothetical protein